jgi:hypothetical protein
MSTQPVHTERRAGSRLALIAGIAAAGITLLAACGDDAKGAASSVTTVAHSAPTTPATSAPATTAPHTEHSRPDTTVAASSPMSTPPSTTSPAPTEPPATAPQDAPSQVDVLASDYAFELSSDVVAAGPVTFTLSNQGSEPHQMHIAAVPDGFTAAQFIDTFETQGEMAAFQNFVWSGGVNGVEPGASQVATAELAPGHYVVMCFIPAAGEHGMPHVSLGMVSELDVVDTGTIAPEPLPVATVELTDFAIAVPERFTGGVVEVVNDGSVNHEFILMRFHDGKSLADLAAWSQGGMPADRPFDYVGGTGTIAPKTRAWATLTLDSGDYVALCVVRGPTDQPHVDLGMITPFSVS